MNVGYSGNSFNMAEVSNVQKSHFHRRPYSISMFWIKKPKKIINESRGQGADEEMAEMNGNGDENPTKSSQEENQ